MDVNYLLVFEILKKDTGSISEYPADMIDEHVSSKTTSSHENVSSKTTSSRENMERSPDLLTEYGKHLWLDN
ncbi:hypothetical protein DPMN_146877 [Dreissena polymorpha]|uniref:Uncharacterized protein n=1 Tax=Dreissena polymorpha TaxID=45954 RepID=A0A9D4J2F8_DREPO|nr:hypothetical protein DPMN_146877 [Dreissena polymorpha]